MNCSCNKLAVLEGLPRQMLGNGATGQGAPPGTGIADWTKIVSDVQRASVEEPEAAKREMLNKATAIAVAAIPIPIVGWIIAGAGLLVNLGLIIIRGRTQHVSGAEAYPAAEAYAAKQLNIYRALPSDAKAFMIDKVFDFNVEMFSRFSTWWGGIVMRDNPGGVGILTAFRDLDPIYAIHGVTSYWFQLITIQADAETVTQNMQDWYADIYLRDVLIPLNDYMLRKYNVTLEQYQQAGGKLIAPETAGTIGWLAVAAIAGALIFAKGKRS